MSVIYPNKVEACSGKITETWPAHSIIMRNKFLTAALFLTYSYSEAQHFAGKIIDSASKQPLKYVSIGIVGKNIGTVSDESGNFTIDLDAQYNNDTLLASMIGYSSFKLVVSKFKEQHLFKEKQIELSIKAVNLGNVIITPNNYIIKVVGNKSRLMTVDFSTNELGGEIGTVMKIKKTPAFIQNVNFNIASNKFDSILFRVNIYKMENGLPGVSILNEPILVTTKMHKGTLSIDLKKYNLYVDDNFFVSLEWIKDLGKKPLVFGGGLSGQPSYMRITSQGTWDKLPLLRLGFYATVLYQK